MINLKGKYMQRTGKFHSRREMKTPSGKKEYDWHTDTYESLFKGRRVLVFALPGAFTPTCSTYQLPDFEKLYDEFKALKIDEVYCTSVNDSFVMNAWAKNLNVKNIKMLPDGSGEFAGGMGMLVSKHDQGMGYRSWRYAVLIDNLQIVEVWTEPNIQDESENDPYGETSPQNILSKLKKEKK